MAVIILIRGNILVETKKELKVRTNKIGDYEIYFEGGGELPAALKGSWNRIIVANQAINHYLLTQKLEDEKQADRKEKEYKQAEDNRAAIKAKTEAKKAAKVKVGKLDGEGQARV